MRNMKLLLILSAGVLSVSTSALAVMSAPNGWYLEANGGSTYLSNKSYPGKSSSSGIGGSASLGYKFIPYFATELGYTRYANTSITDQSTDTKAASDEHYSYDIAGKGILPISNTGLEAFAKLGAQRVNSKVSIKNATAADNIGIGSSSHSATGVYLGVGAQYYFTTEFAVVGQWARAVGSSSTGTLDLLSLGLSFIVD